MNAPSTDQAFDFGPFRLIPSQRSLRENDRPVRLGSRAMDILIVLVASAGEIVGKDDLMGRVWPRSVVDGAALRVHMAALRKVLGDGRAGRRYIATVPQRGYSFVDFVTLVQLDAHAAQQPLAEFPALTVLPSDALEPSHNLPLSSTYMIGRDEIVNALAAGLARYRCLTIVGPGGIGKTTIALRLAERVLRSYPDGTRFVDLAPLGDERLVPLALASVLGVAVAPEDPLPGLVASLRDKHLLIVLDNCEHVIEIAANLAETLLEQLPKLHIVATSREPLRIRDERIQRLQPLDVPPDSAGLSLNDALGYTAVELFTSRCAVILDGFSPGDADVPIIVDICRRLDGIPLAIELAAGQIDQFGLRGLSRLLADRLGLLTRGRRTAAPRHQTLRSTLDWSFNLLAEIERTVLRRLSVFKGRFTLESAAAVCGIPVLERLGNLAAKSLLTLDVGGDDVHYRLLDTTRAYAREKLAESGEHAEIVRRHAEYCVVLAPRIREEWETLPAMTWRSTYSARVDDVRAALDWAFSTHGDAGLGVRLTVASQTLFYQLSLMDEYRMRVELALKYIASSSVGDLEREMLLNSALGHLLLNTKGATSGAAVAFERAFELATQLGDPGNLAQTIAGMWIAKLSAADFQGVSEFSGRFARLSEGVSAVSMDIMLTRMRSTSLHLLGLHELSAQLAQKVLQHPPEASRLAYNSALLADRQVCMGGNLARCLWISGFPSQAIARAHEAIERAQGENAVSLCMSLAYAACPVALWVGDLTLARRWISLLKEHSARHGLGYWHAWGVGYECLVLRGDPDGPGDHAAGDSMWPLQRDVMCTLDSRVLDDAVLSRARAGGSPWCAAEVLRREGELLLRRGLRGAESAAETAFRESLAIARAQKALSWELRTSISLATLWGDQGRAGDASDLLSLTYNQFTEGHFTADLRRAHSLLAALKAHPGKGPHVNAAPMSSRASASEANTSFARIALR
jgi:predicted ATPase/DNA-binding winged helix-turn-helix (wHTH) protein